MKLDYLLSLKLSVLELLLLGAVCSVARNCSFMLPSRSPRTFAKFEVPKNCEHKKGLPFFIQETDERICH